MLSDINIHLEESGFGSDIKPIMDEDYFDYFQCLWTIVSQQNNCEEIRERSGRTGSWRNTKSSFFYLHLFSVPICLPKKYMLSFSSWMNEDLFGFFERTFESSQIIYGKAKHNLLEP